MHTKVGVMPELGCFAGCCHDCTVQTAEISVLLCLMHFNPGRTHETASVAPPLLLLLHATCTKVFKGVGTAAGRYDCTLAGLVAQRDWRHTVCWPQLQRV